MPVTIDEILQFVKAKNASDLHITANIPPTIRCDGELAVMPGDALTPTQTHDLIYALLSEEQKRRFEETNELDTAVIFQGVGRFRVNVFRQRNCVTAALRLVSDTSMTFEQLGMPKVIYDIANLTQGLVLVTGPTGSGKSTTLASLINYVNENRSMHVLSIEDPIEFIHQHKRSIINQREVGQDTKSFTDALRYVLRQDPDIILIGEMRDLETIQAALNIAETGHLVLATLHTNDAVQSINRIIDVFPEHQQDQVRLQLSFVLEAVLCQQLLLHASGRGRVMALEILRASPAVRNLIREAKVEQISTLIQTGSKFGMQTMNQSLVDLYRKGLLAEATALSATSNIEDLRRMMTERSVAAASR
ncbi:MAG: type IV pilus twitching motility protein PilT [Elusimicrobia bacterium]|nr:type IV pilus twitching motility protein PilT [Elusimicrobiota bacterium]